MRFISIGIIGFVLSGCMTTSSHIREVELFPMGVNRYSLFVRGNNFVSNGDVKAKWYEEVQNVCPNGYSVEEVGIKKVTMDGYLKPAVEGTFKCN